jgi:hypothetical protein
MARQLLIHPDQHLSKSLLKNSIEQPLPHGRGSVTAWKHEVSILSRARQQAVLRVFQQAPNLKVYP